VNDVGKPCEGEPHARIDGGKLETESRPPRQLPTLLKGLEYVPRILVTDKLASYGVARRGLMPGVEHRRSKYLNNQCPRQPVEETLIVDSPLD
jgi:hypothetical protein